MTCGGVSSCQDQNREGEEGARSAARDDPDGDQRRGNSRGDGEGEALLPAANVRGQNPLQSPRSHNERLYLNIAHHVTVQMIIVSI